MTKSIFNNAYTVIFCDKTDTSICDKILDSYISFAKQKDCKVFDYKFTKQEDVVLIAPTERKYSDYFIFTCHEKYKYHPVIRVFANKSKTVLVIPTDTSNDKFSKNNFYKDADCAVFASISDGKLNFKIIKGQEVVERIEAEYTAEIHSLFESWKDSRTDKKTPFITDGVMNPQNWFSQNVRPLFLLKEAYGGNSDWDLAKDHVLSNGDARKIWKRISLWTKGIFETDRFHIAKYEPDDNGIKNFNNKYLNSIAAVNVKKYCGNNESDMKNIDSFAEADREKLKKQIELCDPTVIICGYTANALSIILDENFRVEKNNDLFYHTTINGHDVLILDYWHPANQYPEIMNYYTLLVTCQKALNNQAIRLTESKQ